MLSKIFGRSKNRCGENNFKCGTCKACQKEDEIRWNKIWQQKYGQQEVAYYLRDSMSRLEEYSRRQSSLATNQPIVDAAYSLVGTEKLQKSRARNAGRLAKLATMKEAPFPA